MANKGESSLNIQLPRNRHYFFFFASAFNKMTDIVKAEVESLDQDEGKYGWKKWTPRRMQFLNKPGWALVLISGICMNQGENFKNSKSEAKVTN